MNFGEKLKKIRQDRGLTQEEMGFILGTSKQVISRYENGQRTPKYTVAIEYAEKLDLPYTYLIDDDASTLFAIPGIYPLPQMVKRPRLGAIACGKPILAVENIEKYDDVPEGVQCDFTLECKGDSMIGARIHDGDIVYIREQPDVESGEIAAVQIDNKECEVTLKRVKKIDGKVILWPENPNYEPLIYTGSDINRLRILGKATYFLSPVK